MEQAIREATRNGDHMRATELAFELDEYQKEQETLSALNAGDISLDDMVLDNDYDSFDLSELF